MDDYSSICDTDRVGKVLKRRRDKDDDADGDSGMAKSKENLCTCSVEAIELHSL